jgi:hypothetical protein
VYSDHQRLELEKEFHYSRYITIRRKAELAANLGLSERQVSQLVSCPEHPHIHFNICISICCTRYVPRPANPSLFMHDNITDR